MANTNIKIGMDNRVKPGQATRDEVLAALRARGIPAQAAEPIWDPITGELIQTFVNLPDTAAAQAQQVIDANAGVAVQTLLPPPLTISVAAGDIDVGQVLASGGTPPNYYQTAYIAITAQELEIPAMQGNKGIYIETSPALVTRIPVGGALLLYTDSDGNKTFGLPTGYSADPITDPVVNTNPLAKGTLLWLGANAPATLIIPNDTLAISINGVKAPLHFANHANITAGARSLFWLDATRKLYSALPPAPFSAYYTYEEAVNQNGVY